MIGTSNPWFLIQTEFWRVEQAEDYKVWENIQQVMFTQLSLAQTWNSMARAKRIILV